MQPGFQQLMLLIPGRDSPAHTSMRFMPKLLGMGGAQRNPSIVVDKTGGFRCALPILPYYFTVNGRLSLD
jgi:hypothetical protein